MCNHHTVLIHQSLWTLAWFRTSLSSGYLLLVNNSSASQLSLFKNQSESFPRLWRNIKPGICCSQELWISRLIISLKWSVQELKTKWWSYSFDFHIKPVQTCASALPPVRLQESLRLGAVWTLRSVRARCGSAPARLITAPTAGAVLHRL